MEGLTIAARSSGWKYVVGLAITAAVLTLLSVGLLLGHIPQGWIVVAIAVLAIVALCAAVYGIAYDLQATATGLSLLWRQQVRWEIPWVEVAGMAWVRRPGSKGPETFVVARTDGSTIGLRIPLDTKLGRTQAASLTDFWRRAAPGTEPLSAESVLQQDFDFQSVKKRSSIKPKDFPDFLG